MVNEAQRGPIRGPLRYNLETSAPQIEAGRSFSFAVQVISPYDLPVIISKIEIELPIDLGEHMKNPGEIIKLIQRITKEPEIKDEKNTPAPPIELQPGNSVVKEFTVKTRRWLLFQPAPYNLYVKVEYKVDDKTNIDSACFKLNIRAALRAILTGSIVGSIIGFVLHSIYNIEGFNIHSSLSPEKVIPWLMGLVGNVIVAGTVVIAFARKKDAQPILSIEDFWGGLFIGFLAGYTGKSFLNQFISLK